MKHQCARLLVIAVVGSLLAMTGCILNKTDIVVTDTVCAKITEVHTTGSFSTFVVCDQFKTELEKTLKKYGKTKKDVKSIHMVDGWFKSVKVYPHDWNVTADIDVGRQQVYGEPFDEGPAPFVSFENQSLKALKGGPTHPTLAADGVKLINDALASLLNGEDPRLVLLVRNETVSPTPSTSDPLQFELQSCIKFQMVIGKNK